MSFDNLVEEEKRGGKSDKFDEDLKEFKSRFEHEYRCRLYRHNAPLIP
jgi:hypothetical protein